MAMSPALSTAAKSATKTAPKTAPARWQDFVQLLKPRVMSLVVFTALTGLICAGRAVHPVLGAVAIPPFVLIQFVVIFLIHRFRSLRYRILYNN